MLNIFQFVTMAFPKAGVLDGTSPVTVSTVLYILTLLLCRKELMAAFKKIKGLLPVYKA
jgi:hypothetical protein